MIRIRIKAKTPTPAPGAPRMRAKAAKSENSVVTRIARLNALVYRASMASDYAGRLATAVDGDAPPPRAVVVAARPQQSVIAALDTIAASLSGALDRCEVELARADAAIG
jgi:hypothetical protein